MPAPAAYTLQRQAPVTAPQRVAPVVVPQRQAPVAAPQRAAPPRSAPPRFQAQQQGRRG